MNRRRIALLGAAAAAAVTISVGGATSASASAEFPHLEGVYTTYSQCQAAGQAGYNLWGPTFLCVSSGGWVYLYTH